MSGETDAVLSRQTHIKDDHILVDLEFEDDLRGRLSGDVSFLRSSIGTFRDKDDGLVKTAAANVARFEDNGILIEGASTNLLRRSEEFDNAAWTKDNATISANATASPDGNLTADKVVESATTSVHRIFQSISITSGNDYTASIYVKKGERDFITINANAAFNAKAWFNINTGTVGTVTSGSAKIEALVNGWFRCSVVGAATSTASSSVFYQLADADNNESYLGDITKGMFYFGAQAEQLPFASSYIKTTTTAVTRDSDNMSIDAANIPAPTLDYSVSAEVALLGITGSTQMIYQTTGESSSRFLAAVLTTGGTRFRHEANVDGSALPVGATTKIVATKNSEIIELFQDSVSQGSAAPGVFASSITGIKIGQNQASGAVLFGHIKKFRIYDVALTSDQVTNPNLVTEFVTVDFDISFDTDGDILTDDFFDTSLLYSLLGERRADPSEVVEPQLRRGWIGSENKDFENGSKLWLFEQARVTRSNLNRIEDEARKALQWLVDDGFVVSVDEVTATVKNGKITLEIVIRRSRSKVERRFFTLWQNTGLR